MTHPRVLVLLAMLGLLHGTAYGLAIGDRVQAVPGGVMVRDCPGFVCPIGPVHPEGTTGVITDGPRTSPVSDPYLWLSVNFDDPTLKDGWVTEPNIVLSGTPPPQPVPPVKVSGVSLTVLTIPQLNWTANTESDLLRYNVYVRQAAGAYGPAAASVTPPSTRYDVPGLSPKTTYAFTITAVDFAGNESPRSNEVTFTTP